MVRVLRMLQVRGGQGSEQRRQRAPHLTEVLQKLSVKRFTATSCNGLRTPGEAARWGIDALDALRQLFSAGPWLPPALTPDAATNAA
jgi:hypothetical protein